MAARSMQVVIQRHGIGRTVRLTRWYPVVLALVFALAGCSPQTLVLRGVADELAQQSSMPEDDPLLARDAAAFYLKLSESVLARTPDHVGLAAAVSAGLTQYAYAFVASEAEQLETRDAAAALRLRQRAARLYLRAQRHALATLLLQRPELRAALEAPNPEAAASSVRALTPELVELAYWGSASWGAAIGLSTHVPERVAQLPQARLLARLAWQAAPDHGRGALASLMGRLELTRPGGGASQALPFFDRAIALGGAASAAPWLAKAESIALPAGDRAAFEQLLRTGLAASAGRDELAEVVMRQRIEWLLQTLDDRF